MRNEIDIILPNFNSSEYVSEAIESIINQTFKKWKLIIVDDASDKKTKKILSKYKRNKKIKIFWLKKNRGAGFCRNYAINKSNSKYVAFIDSDDIWARNKLELQLRFMKKRKYSFTYTFYKTFGLKVAKINSPLKFTFTKFIKNTSIATSTMMILRKNIKKIIFANQGICEDYSFKCRLLQKVNFAYCLNKYLTKYRIRKNSLQSSKIKNIYWIWKINSRLNKLTFFENINSLICISINSLIKYGFK